MTSELFLSSLWGCIFFGFGLVVGRKKYIPAFHRQWGWSIGIYEGDSPLCLRPARGARNPVFTAWQIDDYTAQFVADPFCVREGGKWYLFFEVLNKNTSKGEIGLAISSDGVQWAYQGTVLSQYFHLSYPHVFKAGDKYYMVPESYQAESVILYEAEEFPFRWRRVKNLVQGVYADSTVFRHDEKWWMFCSNCYDCGNDTLYLFFADDLLGEWRQHPQSPVVRNSSATARMAGKVISYQGRLIRFSQDCSLNYGRSVSAFYITRLSPTEYEETPVENGPVIEASGRGWNHKGMHHIDAVQMDNGKWRAFVDGNGRNLFFGLPRKYDARVGRKLVR